jgi:hypothetical protein
VAWTAWVAAPLEPDARHNPQSFAAPDDLDPEVVSGIHPAWLPDSRRWVALIQVYDRDSRQFSFLRAVVHDTEDPAADRTIAITDLPGIMVMGIITGERPTGASGEAVLLCDVRMDQDAQENGVDSVELYAVPLDTDTTPVAPERWTVPLPGRRNLWWGALAPDGKQIAWLFSSFSATGISSEIGMSGLNGEDMRSLCTIPGTIVSDPDTPSGEQFLFPIPMSLAWLPTGRAISYRYGDSLLVVAVD